MPIWRRSSSARSRLLGVGALPAKASKTQADKPDKYRTNRELTEQNRTSKELTKPTEQVKNQPDEPGEMKHKGCATFTGPFQKINAPPEQTFANSQETRVLFTYRYGVDMRGQPADSYAPNPRCWPRGIGQRSREPGDQPLRLRHDQVNSVT
jgi:hypothetical protein